jgi:1-acyl-sn-glycerol-3-phosphate acyltransferase
LGRGKTGAVRLGLKARVPILPIGVKTKGEKHRLIRGRDRSKPYDAVAQFILKGQRSDLVIGRPISYHEHYNKDADYELLRSLTDDMMRKISELCGQPYEY